MVSQGADGDHDGVMLKVNVPISPDPSHCASVCVMES